MSVYPFVYTYLSASLFSLRFPLSAFPSLCLRLTGISFLRTGHVRVFNKVSPCLKDKVLLQRQEDDGDYVDAHTVAEIPKNAKAKPIHTYANVTTVCKECKCTQLC